MAGNSTCLLIIEDDENIAVMLAEFFHLKDYQVVTAGSGDEGWRGFVEHSPDAVILSGELPDMPGLALAAKIHQSQVNQRIPVVLITDQRRQPKVLMEAGLQPEHQIIKPFDLLELGKLVDTLITQEPQTPPEAPTEVGRAMARLEAQLDSLLKQEDWAILKVSILNLPIFANALGHMAQQDLMSAVRNVIMGIVVTCHDFGCQMLQQPTESLFLLVVPLGDIEPFTRIISNNLARCFDYFYSAEQEKERLQAVVSAVKSTDRPEWNSASLLAVLLQSNT